MTRYRPPAPPKSPYITVEGMRVLEAEQKALWPRRREVVVHLSAAAAEGDRSENAEYIYRKKELRELDRRIRYLQKRLPDLTVVSEKPRTSDRVFFGATVELENEADEIISYRIVGPDELDHGENYISIDSPLARSLLKHELGDEVVVKVPSGTHCYIISGISY
ncbi:MAG: transcription elongation factor GreB [Gammaproteobacteria bacterium]|jgi:transcription elongation factor GreB